MTVAAVACDADLQARYDGVRRFTESLCEPLQTEDYVLQSMTDVSPTKWHLAHTTWFFETFLLARRSDFHRFRQRFEFLFNSYYEAFGDRLARDRRGMLSRPTVREVFEYRRAVDDAMRDLLDGLDDEDVRELVELGLQHEQQHQELLLTDIKHVFSCNPLRPAYTSADERGAESTDQAEPSRWLRFDGGLVEIGHAGDAFAYDNEGPRHQVFLRPFFLMSRLVTAGEYIQFIEDDGYRRAELWLSDGWTAVNEYGWDAPLYWDRDGDQWTVFTLHGARPVDPSEPVCHVSFYEADAFARWAGRRLPTEFEWEHAAAALPTGGNFVESERLHPAAAGTKRGAEPQQMFGDVWEWTASPYVAYPGYRSPAGALGEYNGKFMCNQIVLRGGSCATPAAHIRPTYRNFFQPEKRWQFSGIRLARDVD